MGGWEKQVDVNSEGDAIYSRRVAELSKCQPEALCVCLVRFPGVCLSHARTRVYVHKAKSRLAASARPGTCMEVKKRQRTKRPFPVTNRPGRTEIGCSRPAREREREDRDTEVRVNSQGKNTGQGTYPGGTRHEICRESLKHFFPRVSPLPIFLNVSAEIRRDGVGFP